MTQGNGQKKTNKKTPNKSKVTKRGSRWPLLRSDRALRASLPEGNVKKKRQVTREEQQHRARQRSHQLLLLMVADVIIALPLSSVQGKEVIFGSISFPLAFPLFVFLNRLESLLYIRIVSDPVNDNGCSFLLPEIIRR
jgi:hypothetical protein